MMHDKVRAKLVNPLISDDFEAKGLTFTVESNHETKTNLKVDIQKIDAIYNPECDMIAETYRAPVFFKSIPFGMSYAD